MKIGKKFVVALSILVFFVVVSGLTGILFTGSINQKLLVVTKVTSPGVEAASTMILALWKTNQLMQKFSVESSEEKLNDLKDQYKTVNQDFLEAEINLRSLMADEVILRNLETVSKKQEIIQETAFKIMNQRLSELEAQDPFEKSDRRAEKVAALKQLETDVGDAVAILEEIAHRAKTFSIHADDQSYKAVRNARIILTITTLLSIICAIAIMVYLIRYLIKPIHTLSEAAQTVSGGNFDVQLQEPPSSDEISELTTTFNQMTKSLKNMIEESPRMKRFLDLRPPDAPTQGSFDLESRSSYLIKESSPKKTFSLFLDKTAKGFKGLCITRKNFSIVQEKYGIDSSSFLWLSDTKEKGVTSLSDLASLTKYIVEFVRKYPKSVVLLDRIDYLITKYGFDAVLRFLLKINDAIMVSDALLLIPLDPSTVSMKELSYLEKESRELPRPVAPVMLHEDLLNIVKFIHNQKALGKKITYKDVGHEFHITAPTTQRKIEELAKKGFVKIVKEGRDKVIYLTETAESLVL